MPGKQNTSESSVSPEQALTHIDPTTGTVRMVDVGEKEVTERRALAEGTLSMASSTFRLLIEGRVAKGDPLATARIAGIQAAKRTAELIPLCHTLALTQVTVEFQTETRTSTVRVQVEVRARDRTGVEMEALTAVSVALLTLYDMLKAVDRGMVLGNICLMEKVGGRSGEWRRKESRGNASGTTRDRETEG